nr:hypothetical protein KPHV_84290 [Kitasatospora purpeofusca]
MAATTTGASRSAEKAEAGRAGSHGSGVRSIRRSRTAEVVRAREVVGVRPHEDHHPVDAQPVLGRNILPARPLRASDKSTAERAFSSVKALLLEHPLGFTSTDVLAMVAGC